MIYVFFACRIAQLAASTQPFDRNLILRYFLRLAPFVVLIPLLSWLAFRSGNREKTRLDAAILFFIFLLCNSLIVLLLT